MAARQGPQLPHPDDSTDTIIAGPNGAIPTVNQQSAVAPARGCSKSLWALCKAHRPPPVQLPRPRRSQRSGRRSSWPSSLDSVRKLEGDIGPDRRAAGETCDTSTAAASTAPSTDEVLPVSAGALCSGQQRVCILIDALDATAAAAATPCPSCSLQSRASCHSGSVSSSRLASSRPQKPRSPSYLTPPRGPGQPNGRRGLSAGVPTGVRGRTLSASSSSSTSSTAPLSASRDLAPLPSGLDSFDLEHMDRVRGAISDPGFARRVREWRGRAGASGLTGRDSGGGGGGGGGVGAVLRSCGRRRASSTAGPGRSRTGVCSL